MRLSAHFPSLRRRAPFLVGLLAAGSLFGSAAGAATNRTEQGLMRLEPRTRMIQVCDIRMVQDMRGDKQFPAVDRAVIDAASRPVFDDDTIRGEGGAFRSKGRWFQFSFDCTLAPDHLKTLSFSYDIGDEIPEADWEKFGLW
ncbi:MAG: DUF930 domain-containing protein [Microvirga sp.]